MEGLVSRSGSVKKFKFLRPFIKATEKTEKSCFALDQFYIELKMKFVYNRPAMFNLSNIDNFLPDLHINPSILYWIFRTLWASWVSWTNLLVCWNCRFSIRSKSQFYIQLVFKAPLFITPTISDQKIVSGSLFFQIFSTFSLKKNYKSHFM